MREGGFDMVHIYMYGSVERRTCRFYTMVFFKCVKSCAVLHCLKLCTQYLRYRRCMWLTHLCLTARYTGIKVTHPSIKLRTLQTKGVLGRVLGTACRNA